MLTSKQVRERLDEIAMFLGYVGYGDGLRLFRENIDVVEMAESRCPDPTSRNMVMINVGYLMGAAESEGVSVEELIERAAQEYAR